MKAILEKISEPAAILRVHESDLAEFGDEYEIAVTIRWLSDTKVEVCGLDKPLSKAAWKAIVECLVEEGPTVAMFKRIVRGVERVRLVDLLRG